MTLLLSGPTLTSRSIDDARLNAGEGAAVTGIGDPIAEYA